MSAVRNPLWGARHHRHVSEDLFAFCVVNAERLAKPVSPEEVEFARCAQGGNRQVGSVGRRSRDQSKSVPKQRSGKRFRERETFVRSCSEASGRLACEPQERTFQGAIYRATAAAFLLLSVKFPGPLNVRNGQNSQKTSRKPRRQRLIITVDLET